MSLRPYWQYYKGCFPFLFAIGILGTTAFGFLWGLFLYVFLGPFLSGLAFQAIRNNEYIFYYNLGISKRKLLKIIYLMNLPMAIPVGVVLYILEASGLGFSGT